MGTRAHVIVTDGSTADLDYAERRVEQLEARWSRFREHSEINTLNRAGGQPVVVSRDTVRLLQRCVRGWRHTNGAFDPSVHDAMIANGYDRDFSVVESGPRACTRATVPAPGLGGTVVDVERRLVSLRPGVHVDPGGIGKGLAADLVCAELRARGAAGACVSLGGDVQVSGRAPNGDRWSISIMDPFDESHELARVALSEGAVATSSRLRRVWTRGDERLHHVIDPRTGQPANVRTAAVTAIARSGWWAEVTATSCLLAADPVRAAGSISVLAVGEDRTMYATPDLEEALACSAP